jgi:hypothetical protein
LFISVYAVPSSHLVLGRKKSDGEYHDPCDRSEFYHMSDLEKPAALFVGPDEYDPRVLRRGVSPFAHSIAHLQFALDATFPGFDQALIPMAAEIAEPPIKRSRMLPADRGNGRVEQAAHRVT